MPRKDTKKSSPAAPAPPRTDPLAAVHAQLLEHANSLRHSIEIGRAAERELGAVEAALKALNFVTGGGKTATPPATLTGPRRSAPGNHDTPRNRGGRIPTSGVQSYACAGENDRMDKVGKLRAEGYTRCGAGKPIGPGEYEVMERGGDVTVLWRHKAAA